MKKKILAFVFFALMACVSIAQTNSSNKKQPVNPDAPSSFHKKLNMQSVDSGNIRISYALNATNINKPETYDDLQCLEIGFHLSKYYSFFVFNSDSLVSDWIKKNPHVINDYEMPWQLGPKGKYQGWSEYIHSEYFKDFSKNELTEYIRMPNSLKDYDSQCTEPLPVQDWKMGEDTLTIAGYLCQNATCTFRGRDYTSWFTTDIPISNGPWKFGGLPGLILKVYDKDKQYVFECVGIENHKQKYPIKMHDVFKLYEKLNRKEMWKRKKAVQEKFYQLLKIPNSEGVSVVSAGSLPKLAPYNPLELE